MDSIIDEGWFSSCTALMLEFRLSSRPNAGTCGGDAPVTPKMEPSEGFGCVRVTGGLLM